MLEMTNIWQVFPEDCNPIKVKNQNMVHGGTVLTKADRLAAILCSKLLQETDLVPLTVGVDNCQFYRGPVCGEILELEASVSNLGTSRITCEVNIIDENRRLVFRGNFSFCSFRENPNGDFFLAAHNLKKESLV